MLTGFLANRAGVMGKESEGWLSKLVVNVTCPALILNSVTSCDRLESNAALAVIFLTAAGYFLLLPLLAMLLYLCNVQLPPLIRESVSSVGSVTTPLAMLIIGSSLANQPIGELVKERGVLPFAALRLIALPLVSLLIGRLLIRDNMLLCVLVLASAMPVASNVVTLRKEAGGDDACITKGVFLTTLLSVVTIPLVSVLLGWLGLC